MVEPVCAQPMRLDASQTLQALDAWRRLCLPPSERFLLPCFRRLEIASKSDIRMQQCVEILEACLTFGVASLPWMVSLVLKLHEEQRDHSRDGPVGHLSNRQPQNNGTLSDRARIVCRAYAEEHGVHLPHYVKRWPPSMTSHML
jgi:hypothetical protein